MTATPPEGTSTTDVIRLEDKDRQSKQLENRLTCNKSALLKCVKNVVEAAVSEATQHAKDGPVAVGVIVNRVATAKEIYRQLREQHPEVTGAWHFNKEQWNSVYFTGSIPRDLILKLVDHSYDLVVQGLKKKDREALDSLS